ncbi:hypothetical protein SERLADRAFT_400865 [Serpula lacrymans var. lacrymans S7.9]|uniref:Uncharacterized protein n=1 Tax=Serpula lacrymans var. lacrymans (strain S7.9) TaxID=578457 RepID=F8PAD3_SERL9|nr:uncharacterized protein SERLADRAFT_400865 [Serpula lacrymans var. lacrymans S7.9]EGO19772.1 hypothetical protein SERLADRAFT_400865 [Serpula lacrymans var. lacrymans S7.9]
MKFFAFALPLAATLLPLVNSATKDVKSSFVSCSNSLVPSPQLASNASTNVCGANCTTNCFTPSGGGPDPNDCQVISNALLYETNNSVPTFNATLNTTGVYMQYQTCETFFLNQATTNLTYCNQDWAQVVEYVAFNCQATQNAHGGNCVADDQRWFIQVQTANATSSS